jgi:hypothetical protein
MQEWRERMEALAGPLPTDRPLTPAEIEARFDALPADSLEALGARYGASLLVSRGRYPFPVRFRSGDLTIYSLPGAASLSPPPRSP